MDDVVKGQLTRYDCHSCSCSAKPTRSSREQKARKRRFGHCLFLAKDAQRCEVAAADSCVVWMNWRRSGCRWEWQGPALALVQCEPLTEHGDDGDARQSPAWWNRSHAPLDVQVLMRAQPVGDQKILSHRVA